MQRRLTAGKVRRSLLPLLAVSYAGHAPKVLAQDAERVAVVSSELALRAGEIRLEGRLRSVDAPQQQLILEVNSFTLPNGKTSQLAMPKLKTLLCQAQTVLHVRGDARQAVKLEALTSLENGIFAVAIGPDTGSGKSLPARAIAVWDRVEAGAFRFKDSKVPPAEILNIPPQSRNAAPAPDAAVEQNPAPTAPLTGPLENLTNSIFPPGNFQDVERVNQLVGWQMTRPDRMTMVAENGSHFLRLMGDKQGTMTLAQSRIKLNPQWKTIWVEAKVRASHLQPGDLPWLGAQINYVFEDAAGQRLPDFKAESAVVRADQDWTPLNVASPIRPGAVSMLISLGLWGANGTADFDAVHVIPDRLLDDEHTFIEAPPIRKGLPEGTFEQLDEQGNALGWKLTAPAHMHIVAEEDNHFLRLTNDIPANFMATTSRFKLDLSWARVKIHARMRGQHIKPRGAGDGARLATMFEDAGGNRVGSWQPVLQITQDTDWKEQEVTLTIPEGAVFIKISPELLNTTGIVDYDDISIEPRA